MRTRGPRACLPIAFGCSGKQLSLSYQPIGVAANNMFGVTPRGVLQRDGTDAETIIELLDGPRPAGINSFKAWVKSGFQGVFPDSPVPFARIILHLNLCALARQQYRSRHGLPACATELCLLYSEPSAAQGKMFWIPGAWSIPSDTLSSIVGNIIALIRDVVAVTDDPGCVRQLLNLAWTFESARASKWPDGARCDTTHNTNILR